MVRFQPWFLRNIIMIHKILHPQVYQGCLLGLILNDVDIKKVTTCNCSLGRRIRLFLQRFVHWAVSRLRDIQKNLPICSASLQSDLIRRPKAIAHTPTALCRPKV